MNREKRSELKKQLMKKNKFCRKKIRLRIEQSIAASQIEKVLSESEKRTTEPENSDSSDRSPTDDIDRFTTKHPRKKVRVSRP